MALCAIEIEWRSLFCCIESVMALCARDRIAVTVLLHEFCDGAVCNRDRIAVTVLLHEFCDGAVCKRSNSGHCSAALNL